MSEISQALLNFDQRCFYCWRWNRWFRFAKMRYCFNQGCQAMAVPRELGWKARGMAGGLLVPLGRTA
jgi:hypothetical protein